MGARETEIQNAIRLGVSDIAVIFRINTGLLYSKTGVPVRTGTPGYPDLSGYRKSDGKAVFIEVKTERGVRSKEQENFIRVAQSHGCLAGFARSVEEARQIILDENNNNEL